MRSGRRLAARHCEHNIQRFVFIYLKCFGFGVEVVDGRIFDTLSDDAKARVLNYLKLIDGCWAGERKQDWSCMGGERADLRFESCLIVSLC